MNGIRAKGFAPEAAPHLKLPKTPQGHSRSVRIACIGAGASGINTCHHFEKYLENFELTVYEKNASIGGTWLENQYPGVGCDINAHNYYFSWALNPNWSQVYPSGGEILEYFTDIVDRYGFRKYMKFNHKVIEARWNEDQSVWMLKIENLPTGEVMEDYCHFLINGGGFLNNWKWPDIPGRVKFQGPVIHSANWQPVDLKNKRVALLGNGSSAIQLLVNIHPEVKHITNIIRNPTWVTTVFAADFAGKDGENTKHTEDQKEEWRNDPETYRKYRKAIEKAMVERFTINLKDSPGQKQAKDFLSKQMRTKLDGHPLTDQLVPEFGVSCRRPTPGTGYLETLNQPNVRTIIQRTEEITPKGLQLANGEEIEADVIILATGFDYSWIPRFPIYGRDGRNLQDMWKKRATGYLALTVNNMPNYLTYMGPNCPLSHGSATISIETFTKYFVRIIHKAQTEGYKSFCVTEQAVKDFIEYNDEFHKRTIWSTKCRSSLKGGTEDGPVLTYPGSRVANLHLMHYPRWEDYEWRTILRNRFAFLGNGQSKWEFDDHDIVWYIDDPDAGLEELMWGRPKKSSNKGQGI